MSDGLTEREVAASKADRLLDSGHHRQALDLLASAIAQSPDDPRLLCLLSRARFGLEQWEPALAAARRALAVAPREPAPWMLAAKALKQLHHDDDAVEHARQAVELRPELWSTHVNLALMAADRSGANGLVRAAALKAVELAPDEPSAHFMVGWAAQQAKDLTLAERAYRNVLALDPDHALAHNRLGELHRQRGEHTVAAERFLDSAASDPGYTSASANLDGLVRSWSWLAVAVVNLALLTPLLFGAPRPQVYGWIASAALVGCTLVAALLAVRLGGRVRRAFRWYPTRHRPRTTFATVAVLVLLATAVLGQAGSGFAEIGATVFVVGTIVGWFGELFWVFFRALRRR